VTQVSWTKPLALAATLVVLGTTAYYLEYKRAPEQEEMAEAAKKPLNLKDVSVAQIRVVDGNRRYLFRCVDDAAKMCKPGDNSKWEMLEPIKAKADDSNVNALISSVSNLATQDTIDLKEEKDDKRVRLLREYRLDAPTRQAPGARRVEITMASGEVRTLFLGDTHPVGETIFAGLAQGKDVAAQAFDEKLILLVPTYFKANFDHDLTYWRDKRLLALASHQIKGFKLDWAKAQLSGERNHAQWTLKSKTGEMSGDIESVDSLINGAIYLSAKQFVSESKTDATAKKTLAGAKKAVTLTLQPEAPGTDAKGQTPEPIVVTFLEKGKKLYATVSSLDPVYELDAAAKTKVTKELKDLRMTKLITSMDRFTTKRVEVSGGSLGAPVVLTQADGKWTNAAAPSAAEKEIDSDRLQGLLDKLAGNRIQGFLEGAKIPAGQDQGLRLMLGDEKDSKKRELVFWKSGDRLLAKDMSSKRGEAFEVDRVVKDALPWDREFFKKKPKPAADAAAKPPIPMEAPGTDNHGHGPGDGHGH
jgi:hypothetical protein